MLTRWRIPERTYYSLKQESRSSSGIVLLQKRCWIWLLRLTQHYIKSNCSQVLGVLFVHFRTILTEMCPYFWSHLHVSNSAQHHFVNKNTQQFCNFVCIILLSNNKTFFMNAKYGLNMLITVHQYSVLKTQSEMLFKNDHLCNSRHMIKFLTNPRKLYSCLSTTHWILHNHHCRHFR